MNAWHELLHEFIHEFLPRPLFPHRSLPNRSPLKISKSPDRIVTTAAFRVTDWIFTSRLLCVLAILAGANCSFWASTASADEPVSFARQIRPVLQAKCYGCHQPNLAEGSTDLTKYENFLQSGDSGRPPIIPGDSHNSYLAELTNSADGPPQMPPSGDALTASELDILKRWIDQGAPNDWVSPVVLPDADNPPQYDQLPPVTAVDVSADGRWLAVSGIFEVFLVDTKTLQVHRRLIGMSPRIESIRFAPDSSRLAIAGGRPSEFGELQVWDCESGSIQWSRTVTGDVVRGVSWSPDGTRIAIGCNDTSVRAYDSESAEQVLFQNASEDWVHDTVFSIDGSHLVSVGRDRTCKLTEVATERFVDNITSITPGMLQGGLHAVARHPQRDEILIGGADGTPRLYRIHRLTTRVIGDDANLIRRFPPSDGRIHAVAISQDGKQFAVGSSLDGRGQIQVFSYDFDTTLPEDIKPLLVKVVGTRTPEEDQRLEAYVTQDQKQIGQAEFDSGVFSLCFDSSGEFVWCGTSDGQIRKIAVESGEIVWQGNPAPLSGRQSHLAAETMDWRLPTTDHTTEPAPNSSLPVQKLKVFPDQIALSSAAEYVQLIVMAKNETGTWQDVTAWAEFDGPATLSIDGSGLVQVQPDTHVSTVSAAPSAIQVKYGEHLAEVPVQVQATMPDIQFVRDVQPTLTRLGCNAGSCHGAADGKNGFKLSLRGYDPIFDLRSLTDDLWMRRVNTAEPESSLMLQKATAAVPHQGGQLIEPESKTYWLLHQWIAAGAKLEAQPIRTVKIVVEPSLPVLASERDAQQVRVVAHYPDGSTRDVTRSAFIEVGDMEIASVNPVGRVTAIRRGETAIMARFDGCYAATTLTVMGDRTGFHWSPPPRFNEIDDFVIEKWERMKIQPAPLCSDHEFVRRIYLDLTGLPPTSDQVTSFVDNTSPTQEKRAALVDQLLQEPAYVDYWTNKWSDLLQVNSKFLGREGAAAFHGWIREQIATNRPYDEFVRDILTVSGSNREQPATAYYKILRQPDLMMENTTHLFLATRFNCNKCHDHPFERWTQDQYFETAAFFAQVGLAEDPASEGKRIGGSAVEGSQALYEIVSDKPDGEMIHDRTREVTSPQFPFPLRNAESQTQAPQSSTDGNRRTEFAQWLTSPENPYFASSYVNRVWGYLLGTGLIEPIDDVRASNPPSNPELLAFLEQSFIRSNFDTRELVGLICKSRVYQLSVERNPYNQDDVLNYSRAKAKRLPAEVLYDSLHQAVGAKSNIPGVPAGTRAIQLSDVALNVPSGFLATLGRPVRESACECERSDELQLGAVLAMVSGPDVARIIADPQNIISALATNPELNDPQLVDAIYLQVLNRPATDLEIEAVLELLAHIRTDHTDLQQAVAERQQWWEQEKQRLEGERAAAISQAEIELQKYIAEHDPSLPQKEVEREQKIADAKRLMAEYESNEVAEFQRWRTEQLTRQVWHPHIPAVMSQSNDSQLQLLSDRSIRATLGKGAVETNLEFETPLPLVTGVRLEALADVELASGGPGLAPHGNFVVSEWVIEYATSEQPDQWQKVTVGRSMADYIQPGFTTDKLFNGVVDNNGDGWAVNPETKKTHWVVVEFSQPVALPAGGRWRMKLIQNYSDHLHALGRFRVSFASHEGGLELGLAEPLLADLVNLPPLDSQTLAEWAPPALLDSFRAGDGHRQALLGQLADAERPVELLPGIVERRAALAHAQRPVPEDPLLVRMQNDLQMSETQVGQIRLTLAQDLTWALINSPAFMFNY